VGPRAGLDTEDGGKILCPCRGSNPDRTVVQPVVKTLYCLSYPGSYQSRVQILMLLAVYVSLFITCNILHEALLHRQDVLAAVSERVFGFK
jgi:hypothetical protein